MTEAGFNGFFFFRNEIPRMKSCLAWLFFGIAIMVGVAIFVVSVPIMFIAMFAILLI